MKESRFNLVSSVFTLVLGAVLAFIVTNLFLGVPSDVTIKTIETVVSKDVSEPDENIFNAQSINPTVEVFVGGEKE